MTAGASNPGTLTVRRGGDHEPGPDHQRRRGRGPRLGGPFATTPVSSMTAATQLTIGPGVLIAGQQKRAAAEAKAAAVAQTMEIAQPAAGLAKQPGWEAVTVKQADGSFYEFEIVYQTLPRSYEAVEPIRSQ
jgi:hypothetical protein